ncbi:hypothetical protein HDU83_004881 [Entophlyctis luteolus]|nr:hypothetical protein HDU83_004881 [Entophlyctis luteolus]
MHSHTPDSARHAPPPPPAGVTLLDLYNFHLASSPRSPVAASLLANLHGSGGATGSNSANNPATSASRSSSPLASTPARKPFPPTGASLARTSAGASSSSLARSVPKRSNFVCCGITFATFPLLAEHYEETHSRDTPANAVASTGTSQTDEDESAGLRIPAKGGDEAQNAPEPLSLSDLLSFSVRRPLLFEPSANPPPSLLNEQKPKLQPISDLLSAARSDLSRTMQGESQLSLGLKQQQQYSSSSASSTPSPDFNTQNPTDSVFKMKNSADAMLTTGGSSEDLDAALSALLSQPASDEFLVREHDGKPFANKRTLSSAAFSLGSYTAEDLRKLRKRNYSGIDFEWLLPSQPSNASTVAEPNNASLFSSELPRVLNDSVFAQDQYQRNMQKLLEQEQLQQQEQVPERSSSSSISIPAHIGEELVKPIDITTLTPEVYLRMLLEAHQLVGEAHSYIGGSFGNNIHGTGMGMDFESSNAPSSAALGLPAETVAQLVAGVQGIHIANAEAARNHRMALQQALVLQQMQQIQHLQQQEPQLQPPLPPHAPQRPQNRGRNQKLTKTTDSPDPQRQDTTNSARTFPCEHCGKIYKSQSGHKYHLDHQHPTTPGAAAAAAKPLADGASGALAPAAPLLLAPRPVEMPLAFLPNRIAPLPPQHPPLAAASVLPLQAVPPAPGVDSDLSLFGADGLPRRQIHPSQFNKQFKCTEPGCLKSYKNKGGLKYHLLHEHPRKD